MVFSDKNKPEYFHACFIYVKDYTERNNLYTFILAKAY